VKEGAGGSKREKEEGRRRGEGGEKEGRRRGEGGEKEQRRGEEGRLGKRHTIILSLAETANQERKPNSEEIFSAFSNKAGRDSEGTRSI
jgi:hypothetical protein